MAFVFLLMLNLASSQLSIQPFTFQSILTIPTVTSFPFATIRNNQKQQYVSAVENKVTKIIKFNTTTSNVYRLGEYLLPTNITHVGAYAYIYFFRQYILACNVGYPCRVFNDSSFAYIGTLNNTLLPARGFFLESRSLFVFGTRGGTYFGYFAIDTLPNVNPIVVKAVPGSGYVYVDKSAAENYFSVSFSATSVVEIYRTSDFQRITTVTGLGITSNKQIWSGDERYVMLFYGGSGNVIVFDRTQNWAMVANISTGYRMFKYGFYSNETNVAVAFASSDSALITISFSNFAVTQIRNVSGIVMAESNTLDGFGIQNSNRALFFTILPYCFGNKIFNQTSGSCIICDTYCAQCATLTTCNRCIPKYFLQNGTCKACPFYCSNCTSASVCTECEIGTYFIGFLCGACSSGTFYNSSQLSCDSCSINCTTCSSAKVCINCARGNLLIDNSCVDEFSCPSNCMSCLSPIRCLQCENKFELTSNFSCQSCPDKTFYDQSQKNCVSCFQDCLQCTSRSNCMTCPNGKTLIQGFCFVQGSIFEEASKLTISNEMVKKANQLPGGRVVFKRIFTFLASIDQLWLYIYHKRYYGLYVSFILNSVQQFEDKKWNLASDNVFTRFFGFDSEYLSGILNYKIAQTSQKFIQIQSKSSSFLQNSIHYFLLNVPLTFAMFFALKIVYNLVKKFEISSLLKEYPFNALLLVMLFQGNLQLFSYHFVFDSSNSISYNFQQKIMNSVMALFFWLTIVYIFSGIFLIRLSYQKNTKYFLGNYENSLKGIFTYFFQNGAINFLLGTSHLILQNQYNTQLFMLLIIEASFVILMIILISKSTIILKKRGEWQNIMTSFLRICLIFSYYIDQHNPGKYQPVEQFQMIVLTIYLLILIVSTFIQILIAIWNLAKIIFYMVSGKNTLDCRKLEDRRGKTFQVDNEKKLQFKVKIQRKIARYTTNLSTQVESIDPLNKNIKHPEKVYSKFRQLKNQREAQNKNNIFEYKFSDENNTNSPSKSFNENNVDSEKMKKSQNDQPNKRVVIKDRQTKINRNLSKLIHLNNKNGTLNSIQKLD